MRRKKYAVERINCNQTRDHDGADNANDADDMG